jgi:putative phosphoribosyl transferase
VTVFADREDAGRALGELLARRYAGRDDVVVLGVPRGGVVVARPVADRLGCPLDALVVRKLGAPGQPELALGALATGGVRVVDERLVARLGVSAATLDSIVKREAEELRRRERELRGADRPPEPVRGRTVLLVDDGIATGSSLRAAAVAVRARDPAAVVAAAPVGPAEARTRLTDVCDDVVLVEVPPGFSAVGSCYADFRQTTDDEVRAALR